MTGLPSTSLSAVFVCGEGIKQDVQWGDSCNVLWAWGLCWLRLPSRASFRICVCVFWMGLRGPVPALLQPPLAHSETVTRDEEGWGGQGQSVYVWICVCVYASANK